MGMCRIDARFSISFYDSIYPSSVPPVFIPLRDGIGKNVGGLFPLFVMRVTVVVVVASATINMLKGKNRATFSVREESCEYAVRNSRTIAPFVFWLKQNNLPNQTWKNDRKRIWQRRY